MLSKKLEYLNKMARDPGFGADGAYNLRLMRVHFNKLNKMRKSVIHGVIFHRNPQGVEWEVQLRTFAGGSSKVERYHATDSDFRVILSHMSAFSRVISPLIQRWIASTP
jgi:hypothetical protein